MATAGSDSPFVLGAVAYDPKVVTIWEGFKDWFADQGFAFDYVLYSNYEAPGRGAPGRARRRHLGLAAGLGAHPAPGRGGRARRPGRSPCATPTRTSPRSCSCGPTATSPRSPQLAGTDGGHRRGRLAAGDAAAARPPRRARPRPRTSFTVRRFDVMVGKHGDHVGGERDAVQGARRRGGRRRLRDRRQPARVRQGGHRSPPGAVRVLDPHRAVRPLHDDGARRRRRRRRSTGSSSCSCRCRSTTRPCGRCSSWRA